MRAIPKFSILLFSSFLNLQCASKNVETPRALPAPSVASPVEAQIEGPRRATVQAFGKDIAIATQGLHATRIASETLQKGGNLMDAAIATSFAISVERPQSTGIGGGGFLLYHEAKTGKTYAVDFRERAPKKATEKMYLNESGQPDRNRSRNGILAVAVPGLIAGLAKIHQKFGKLPLAELIGPAAKLADEGFLVYPELHAALKARKDTLARDPQARALFLDDKGEPWPVGHLLQQKDLAKTLRRLAKVGWQDFYKGEIARQIARFSKSEKGLITLQDLGNYSVKWRTPVEGQYAGYEILSMPPPSSGGIHVIQFLNMLEKDHLAKQGYLSARSIHLAASALQSAFADRARYLGDADFVKVPVEGLTSKDYAEKRRHEFKENEARHVNEVQAGKPAGAEPLETTHFSMMDSEGNAISSTQTVNGWMGASVVVPGTGILLNNEMDDFSAHTGAQNLFGAVGGKPNAIEGGKTPLSSMSPTILLKDGKPEMVVGAPGGTRIISCVAETILNVLEFHMPLDQAVSSVRYHHQWQPDVLTIDPPGPAPEVLQKLKSMGYQIDLQPVGCKVMAVLREGDKLHAVSDPRDIGTAWAQ